MKLIIKLLALILAVMLCSCDAPTAETTGTSEIPTGTVSDTEPVTTDNPSDGEIIYSESIMTNEIYKKLFGNLSVFPFSYKYGGEQYYGLSDGLTETKRTTEDIKNGVHIAVDFDHAASGTVFVLDVYIYPEYSAYEYKVTINNNSGKSTGAFADLFYNGEAKLDNAYLKGLNGDAGGTYTPYSVKLKSSAVSKSSTGGRPTHGDFPYFNISGDNGGVLFAVGWSGCWRARFSSKNGIVGFYGGQNKLNTTLNDKESVRSPLFAVVEYKTDATNAWRHYFINCVLRTPEGYDEMPTLLTMSHMSDSYTTGKALTAMKAYYNHGIKHDCLWLDAGWYTGSDGETVGWPSTGTLNVDKTRYPDAFADISSFMHGNGAKLLLWFEPEVIRQDKDKFLAFCPDFKEEWLLGKAAVGSWLEGWLTDLGNPECVDWLVGKIEKVMKDGGVDIYRQDFNVEPASVWQAADEKGRAGLTENKYVVGYLAFWDKLLADNPSLIIDSCASGGGRNDLETMKRSVPLHYSDWFDGNNEDYDMKQKMTQALYAWFPYFKNEVYENSLYKLRCNYSPMFILKVPSPIRKDVDWELALQAQNEYNRVREYFYGDYYELTEWSAEPDRYNGWMFFDEEKAGGFIMLQRTAKSTDDTVSVKLSGLDADKTYALKDFDGLLDITATGAELMQTGITVKTPEAPYAVVIMITVK